MSYSNKILLKFAIYNVVFIFFYQFTDFVIISAENNNIVGFCLGFGLLSFLIVYSSCIHAVIFPKQWDHLNLVFFCILQIVAFTPPSLMSTPRPAIFLVTVTVEIANTA